MTKNTQKKIIKTLTKIPMENLQIKTTVIQNINSSISDFHLNLNY